jgi:hypothetical protein
MVTYFSTPQTDPACLDFAAAVALAGGPAHATPIVATSLDISKDCWQLHNSKLFGCAPSRDRQFTAFNGTTSLAVRIS